MSTETITVPEIHCGSCKASIEGALQPMEGVRSAEVDVEARHVSIQYDEKTVSREQLVSAIEEQGFAVPA